jgi:gliding motility-associated-like protein
VHQTGEWSVTVTDDLGCKATSDFVVTVLEDKEVQPIPVITPNGDGSNDFFKIKRYLLPGDQYELTIYNRYGNEIYSSSNYQNDWDGKYEGTLVPEGPYYYFLKDKAGNEWKGPINVVYNY